MSDVTGKTVLITGASRGIGEAAARIFAAKGAQVVLCARSSADINAIAKSINDTGGKASAIACNVADRADVDAAVARAVNTFGGLDILIGNAGILKPIGRITDLDVGDFDSVIDVNVKGVWYGIKAALPHMKGGGTIITIGSGAATSALEGWAPYCASKAAVHHLSACLHKEMADEGIRALVLSPGTVATEMQKDIKKSGINPVSELDWSDHIPPQWVADCLLWMCGSDADAHLGQVISLRDDAIRKAVGLA